MYRQFCQFMVRRHENLRRKSKWMLDEEELIKFLMAKLPINKTNSSEVQDFLNAHNIANDMEHQLQGLEFDVDSPVSFIYLCSLPGPIRWDYGFPTGSEYQIRFCFDEDKTLILVKAGLFVYHI